MRQSLNFDKIMARSVAKFRSYAGDSPGLIARAILAAINHEVEDTYQAIDYNLAMALFSRSKGPFLNMFGHMMDCDRNHGETDEDYKYRISQQVNVAANANEAAVRIAMLQVPGVQNIKIQKYTLGTGSFTIFPIIQVGFNEESVMQTLQQVLNEKEALGVRGVIRSMNLLRVDVRIRLYFKDGISLSAQADIQSQSRQAIRQYLESLQAGEELVINEIRGRIMSMSEQLHDIKIQRLAINGTPRLFNNQKAHWDEKFVPNIIEII